METKHLLAIMWIAAAHYRKGGTYRAALELAMKDLGYAPVEIVKGLDTIVGHLAQGFHGAPAAIRKALEK